jgi:phage terminase large subunit-like protein
MDNGQGRLVQSGTPWRDLPYGLKGFRVFCRSLVLENGEPFELEPHEVEIVRDYFGGTLQTVIVIGKKNGKTTLFAALALYHLDMVRNAKCYIGASTRDQATYLFEQAEAFVINSDLEDVFKTQGGYRRILLRDGRGGLIKVLAGDVDSADGMIPTLALVDELHRHRNGDLLNALTLGLSGRQGRMIVISTAAATLENPLGVLRERAHAEPSFRRDHKRKKNTARSEDGAFVWHEWCLDPGEDIEDIALVKKVNPASWHTSKTLGMERPLTKIYDWMRFRCGLWTEGESPWIEPQMWDVTTVEGLEILEGSEVVVGVYAGLREQDTGLVILRPNEDESMDVKATVWPPPFEVTVLESEIVRLGGIYKIGAVAYAPPLNFVRSAEVLEAKGFDMWDFPISQARMEDASADLLDIIEQKHLHHDGDGTFRAHVLAGVTKQTEHGWRLVKDPKRRSISALTALLAAVYYRDKVGPTSYWVL